MVIVYEISDNSDRVVVATVQDELASNAAAAPR
jgi:hypothetical protein